MCASTDSPHGTEPRRPGGMRLLPALLTVGNLGLGLVALELMFRGDHWVWAVAGCTAAAALLDGVDGALARRLAVDGPLGARLDSLADLVSFGLVPACAVRFGAPAFMTVGAGLYVVASTLRLARPMRADRAGFVGLPTPAAALVVTTAVAGFAGHEPSEGVERVQLAVATMAGASILASLLAIVALQMHVSVRYPRFGSGVLGSSRAGRLAQVVWVVAVAGTAAIALRWVPCVCVLGYVLLAPSVEVRA